MYCRMLKREHSAILSNFIKLPVYTIKEPYVLSIFECPFNTNYSSGNARHGHQCNSFIAYTSWIILSIS